MVSNKTFYPAENSSPPLVQVGKNFFEIARKRVSKEEQICADLKRLQKLVCYSKGEKFTGKLIFRDFIKFIK
jgi:hypothetical protein